ncbi:hypothetical protein GKZ89_06235 [Bacillus mangrovi]|uniref:Uncharacterized protein n=1 Tax=Metabacillus mangrovi TaxID=1491830 RepID=A0A7X2S3H3_9BACI|nr:hypothetical protein [Metabacillus mangrovi]MTH53004.1 hypothetical protein [Metabacillus mangrovi]
MLMFIAILLSGILLAAEIYFYLKALDRGRALAYGLADESRFIIKGEKTPTSRNEKGVAQ